MKVSTRGRYGVNAMYELAINYGMKPMSMKSIAAKQGIPENYLEQLLGQLRHEELVVSTRGAQGGYKLIKPPQDISIGQILYALEGPLAPVDCVVNNESCDKLKNGTCASFVIWKKIYDEIRDIVDNISLADLIIENNIN